jgi:phosphoethanolamine N-methyltransferase
VRLLNVPQVNYPPGSFDVIYSRDTILHIEDKATLFRNFYRWLRPGGRLLIRYEYEVPVARLSMGGGVDTALCHLIHSDYCCGPNEHTKAFKEYVAQRGYHLLTVEKYGQLIQQAGFKDVQVCR